MQAVPTQAYTFVHETGGLYTFNTPVAFPVAYNQGNYLDVPDLTYAAASPESIASPRTPGVVATSLPLQQASKKPRSRRPKDPNRVGRPANSFMIFRSELNASVQNSGNADKVNQQEISRHAAELWRNFSSEEKQRYVDAAAEQSRKHRESHPDGLHSRRGPKSIKRARAQKPYDRPENNTTERVNADVVPYESVLPSTAVPGSSPEQWLGPQPSQFIDPILTQCVPSIVVDHTGHAPVDPQFDVRLDSIYWQLMPPSIDTTTQPLAPPPADQELSIWDPFNVSNWPLSNETTDLSISQLNDHKQQLFDQFLSDLEASRPQ